jgi:ribosome-associated protein
MSGPLAFIIPATELNVRVSRASGAGGQHVNKTSTRVALTWNIRESAVLSEEQRERLLRKLASRLHEDGSIRVVASDTRSQYRNRVLAEERLNELVRRALEPPKPRKKTKPTAASKERRLQEKRLRARKKAERRGLPEE